jgi:hypothetical protein
MFFTITFTWFVRAVAHFNSFRNGAKNSTIQIKAKYDDFQPVGDTQWFVKNWLALKE